MTTKKEAELIKVATNTPTQIDSEKFTRIIDANFGGDFTFRSLPKITVPIGDGCMWRVTNPEGESTTTDALLGIILHIQKVRVYWPNQFGQGDSFPSCTSDNGRIGKGDPGGVCADCPKSAWRSTMTRGPQSNAQACSEQRAVFLLEPDHVLPTIVRLPPSAITSLATYAGHLGSLGFLIYEVVTKMGLTPKTNKAGMSYSHPTFRGMGEIDLPMIDQMEQYRTSLVRALLGADNMSAILHEAAQNESVI